MNSKTSDLAMATQFIKNLAVKFSINMEEAMKCVNGWNEADFVVNGTPLTLCSRHSGDTGNTTIKFRVGIKDFNFYEPSEHPSTRMIDIKTFDDKSADKLVERINKLAAYGQQQQAIQASKRAEADEKNKVLAQTVALLDAAGAESTNSFAALYSGRLGKLNMELRSDSPIVSCSFRMINKADATTIDRLKRIAAILAESSPTNEPA